MFLQAGSKPLGGKRKQDFSSRTVAGFGTSGISNEGSISSTLRGYRSLSKGRLSFGSESLCHLYGGYRGSQHTSMGMSKGFCGFGAGPYSYGGEPDGSFGGGYGARFDSKSFSDPGIQPIPIHANFLQPVHRDPHLKHQEKEQIKHLNNQFVFFIDKVECLEKKNTALSTHLHILRDTGNMIRKTSLEPVFENYIRNLQMQIECMKSQNGQLQFELRCLEFDVADYRGKFLSMNDTSYQDPEQSGSRYEDEINSRRYAENQFVALKKDVDLAYLRKTQLEAKVEALQSQIAFFMEVFEQELCQMLSTAQQTSVTISMENSRELNADHLIAEYEYQYSQVAQEAKAKLQQKYEDLKVNTGCQEDALHEVKQESHQLLRQIQKVQLEIDSVKKQVAKLQLAICEAEQRGELDLEDAQKKLDKFKVTLQREKEGMARILKEYQELMNVKLAIDMEITVYQKLLEGEESRLWDGIPGLATVRNESIISSGGSSFYRGMAGCRGSIPAGGGTAESYGTSSEGSESGSSSSPSTSSSTRKNSSVSEGGGVSTGERRSCRIKKHIKTFAKMIFNGL